MGTQEHFLEKSVSRSLGFLNGGNCQSSIPDINSFPLEDNDVVLILGTRGLFKNLENTEVAESILTRGVNSINEICAKAYRRNLDLFLEEEFVSEQKNEDFCSLDDISGI